MKMGVVQNKVWFLLDEEELLPYEVTLAQFRERKPFKENIILELVKKAYDEYGNCFVKKLKLNTYLAGFMMWNRILD